VTEFRYRAYISYSHADERWAAWLQRVLESYRVPARLASRAGDRPLPRRIAPVFRDREDLSSAHSLTDSLVSALRDSEALILVCSPSAATSHWVNEEVRQFQALGRSDRIFCMIVDGDPAAGSGEGGCFPPALFDGVQDAIAEPLAADPRAFADGKKLAKLKLIAGLLGVRLDELRQRDLKRRRRWQVAGALATVAAIALAGTAVTSRMAQHQERAKAEQMANFIVDLGEDLKSELDLESLGRISERAMAYLQDLDPKKLSPDTSIRVGLALRQVGIVNLQQGAFDKSLAAFEQSRQLFRDLNEKYPEREDMLFELGQAEFYVGDCQRLQGAADAAWEPWNNYYDISKALYDSAPDDPKWLLELSYATGNLMLLRIASEQAIDQQFLEDLEENVSLAERALAAQPGDSEVLANYSNTLAWAADAQYLACNLAQAGQYREITLEQAQRAVDNDPSNKDLRRDLAYRHSGMAMVLEDQGNLAEAEQHPASTYFPGCWPWTRATGCFPSMWRPTSASWRACWLIPVDSSRRWS
jgi:tetratricopeptide (TPR) repeat protein